MSWLRLDDGFAEHPKILDLTDAQFRAWVKLLLYCARFRTEGDVTEAATRQLSIRNATLQAFISAGLLDVYEGDYAVHDWAIYNPSDPTNAERQARFRAKRREKRNGKSNENRNASDRDSNTPSRAGARARPVPSPRDKPDEPEPPPELEPNEIRDKAFRAYRSNGGNLTLEKPRQALARNITTLIQKAYDPKIIIAAAADLGRTDTFPGYLKQRADELIANGGLCRNRGLDKSKLPIAKLEECGCTGKQGCHAWAEALRTKA